jgi:hypothetical protein
MEIKDVEFIHLDDSELNKGETCQNPTFDLDISFYPTPGTQLPFKINGNFVFCVEFEWDIVINDTGVSEYRVVIYDYAEFEDGGQEVTLLHDPDLNDDEPKSNVIHATFGAGNQD